MYGSRCILAQTGRERQRRIGKKPVRILAGKSDRAENVGTRSR
jgi:hypothetical protein